MRLKTIADNGRLVLLCFSRVPGFVYQQQFIVSTREVKLCDSFSSRPRRRFGVILSSLLTSEIPYYTSVALLPKQAGLCE